MPRTMRNVAACGWVRKRGRKRDDTEHALKGGCLACNIHDQKIVGLMQRSVMPYAYSCGYLKKK